MEQKTINNLLNLVKINYQEIAEAFALSRRKEVWPEIRELAKQIKPQAKVLDVGCGNGRLLEVFQDKKIDYLGIDNSQALVDLARNHYPNKFLLGDALDLGFIKDKFNNIFCLAVLQHIPSKKLRIEVLKQMAGKLEKNGMIIISSWNLWSGKHKKLIFTFYLKRIFKQNKMEFGDILFPWKNSQGKVVSQRYYHAFTTRELKKVAQGAGLKIVKLYHDKYNYWLLLKLK